MGSNPRRTLVTAWQLDPDQAVSGTSAMTKQHFKDLGQFNRLGSFGNGMRSARANLISVY